MRLRAAPALALVAALALVGPLVDPVVGCLGATAQAAPRPRTDSGRAYDTDILGFNDGAPYRVEGAAAEAVLGERGAVVHRFASRDWMDTRGEGSPVPASRVAERYPNRRAAELFAVYRVDLDADGSPEVILVADAAEIADGHRYAPTVLTLGERGYEVVWTAERLAGERYRVVDIRDLNDDGRPELLLAGEAGRSGAYQFHEAIGRGPEGFASLSVRHVDSIHYVDLDHDRRLEVVLRQRVGRRGPAYQWTYVDHLFQWDGAAFVDADRRYPRYHDEETLPTLVGDLIDHHDAKPAILDEKVEAILSVRAAVLAHTPRPPDLERRVIPALAALQKDEIQRALRELEAVHRLFPYEPQVLVGLAQVHAALDRFDPVLDYAIRAITVDPRDRRAWWWAGVAFMELEERSSAVASFHNLVRLCGPEQEGVAFLLARRGEPGMEGSLQRAIDTVLGEHDHRK